MLCWCIATNIGPPNKEAQPRTEVAPLLASQTEMAIACMLECGLSLGGYGGVALARAYIQEALNRPDRLLILLASSGPEVHGFLVVLRAPWTFWWGFLSRHPLLALKMGAHALRRAELSADEIPSRWHSDSSGFQRILMIAVSSSRRRRGMGRSLYMELFARGQQDFLALVSPDNPASMALHRSTGWSIESSGGSPLLATRKASPRDRSQVAF